MYYGYVILSHSLFGACLASSEPRSGGQVCRLPLRDAPLRCQDLDKWAELFNHTGRRIMIENCHWGGTVPNATWCPWNFFRLEGRVEGAWRGVVVKLMSGGE